MKVPAFTEEGKPCIRRYMVEYYKAVKQEEAGAHVNVYKQGWIIFAFRAVDHSICIFGRMLTE